MYSQQFEFRKDAEGELRLRAIARVHLDGKIHDVGAFEAVFVLPTLSKEKLANCPMFSLPVAVKTEPTDSGDLRVVLSSTCRKNISEALRVLQRELDDDIVDWTQIDTTESHLTVCCEAVGMVGLRLQYKWRSEAISVVSKDFLAIGESSCLDASTSASDSGSMCPFFYWEDMPNIVQTSKKIFPVDWLATNITDIFSNLSQSSLGMGALRHSTIWDHFTCMTTKGLTKSEKKSIFKFLAIYQDFTIGSHFMVTSSSWTTVLHGY